MRVRMSAIWRGAPLLSEMRTSFTLQWLSLSRMIMQPSSIPRSRTGTRAIRTVVVEYTTLSLSVADVWDEILTYHGLRLRLVLLLPGSTQAVYLMVIILLVNSILLQ